MCRVVVLEISQDIGYEEYVVYPVALVASNEIILIDCGFIGSLTLLKDAFIRNDLEISNLKKVIVTHHDHDHVANLAALKREYPSIMIYATNDERLYLEGHKQPLRLTQALEMQEQLPDEQQAWGLHFIELVKKVELVKVDCIVQDVSTIPFNTKVEIVTTPGHTKGHLSVYLEDSKTLVAGDALVVEAKKLKLANPELAYNLEEAKHSLAKLLSYDIEAIICYHGGVFKGAIKSELSKLL